MEAAEQQEQEQRRDRRRHTIVLAAAVSAMGACLASVGWFSSKAAGLRNNGLTALSAFRLAKAVMILQVIWLIIVGITAMYSSENGDGDSWLWGGGLGVGSSIMLALMPTILGIGVYEGVHAFAPNFKLNEYSMAAATMEPGSDAANVMKTSGPFALMSLQAQSEGRYGGNGNAGVGGIGTVPYGGNNVSLFKL